MSSQVLQPLVSAMRVLVIPLLLALAPLPAMAAGRVALVIGNADYPSAPLKNPVNDARAIARALRDLGFEVISLENASKERMEQTIVRFAGLLDDDSSALFYYAGHGMQVNGRNYLVPVDAEIDSEREVRIETVGMDLVLEEMAYSGSRINIVILDACRNNPFERRLRGGSRGLAAIDAAAGTIIAYATSPGAVAQDGDGGNGIYTEELLRALREPGLEIEEVFKRARVGVARRTNQQQIPWESSSLTGNLVLKASSAPASAGTRAQGAPPDTADARFDGEWMATRSCDAFREMPAFVDRHPATARDGEFVLERGRDGEPGYQRLRGKPTADGDLVLTGTAIAGARPVRGRRIAVFLRGRFDGEQFLLEGQYGKRHCNMVIARTHD